MNSLIPEAEDATAEEATVAPHEAAIIVGPNGFRLLLPKLDDDDNVQDYVLAVVRIATKLKDHDYMLQLAEEYRQDIQMTNALKH